jgi:hypothetical protein
MSLLWSQQLCLFLIENIFDISERQRDDQKREGGRVRKGQA